MVYIPLEKLLAKTDGSIFKLVVLAARRSLELAEGQPALVAASRDVKPSAIALQEIAEGKLTYKRVK